jgi:hypothetical protein
MRIFALDGASKEELHNALHGFLPRDFLAQLKKLPEISRPPHSHMKKQLCHATPEVVEKGIRVAKLPFSMVPVVT